MPSDDLILNLRQIASYPGRNPVIGSDAVLLQGGGLGGPYLYTTAEALVSTALAASHDTFQALTISAGTIYSSAHEGGNISGQFFQGGTFNGVSGAFGALSVDNVPVASQNDLANAIAGVTHLYASSTVWSFNGRSGSVFLFLEDILGAGGAPIMSPQFLGHPTAPTPPPGDNSISLATTAFVTNAVLNGVGAAFAPLDSPNFSGIPTAPTANAGTSTGQLATTAFVQHAITASTTGVSSFNTRTGAIVLAGTDITAAGGALLNAPAFTGVPTAPTPAPGTNSGQLATTAFVTAALPPSLVSSFNGRTGAVTLSSTDIAAAGGALSGSAVTNFNGRTGAVTFLSNDLSAVGGALLASPAFSGTPTAPTAASGTSNTQLATTAFVTSALGSIVGVSSFNTRTGVVTLTGADLSSAGGALLASPALSGVPTAPTAGAGTNSTQLATCAFVAAAISAAPAVASFNSRTGAVTLQANDVSAAGGALLASPSFTGVPTAPTAVAGTNTGQLATTAFVEAAIGGISAGVITFNGRGGAVTLNATDITGAGGALLASPVFTGTPSAPTAPTATATTQVATTGFVRAGVSDGSNAAAGQVGEFMSSIVSGVGLASALLSNITSLTLPAGDWEARGGLNLTTIGSGTVNNLQVWVNNVSATTPPLGSVGHMSLVVPSVQAGTQLQSGARRFSLSASTTIYLSAYQQGGSSLDVAAEITARRIR